MATCQVLSEPQMAASSNVFRHFVQSYSLLVVLANYRSCRLITSHLSREIDAMMVPAATTMAVS